MVNGRSCLKLGKRVEAQGDRLVGVLAETMGYRVGLNLRNIASLTRERYSRKL